MYQARHEPHSSPFLKLTKAIIIIIIIIIIMKSSFDRDNNELLVFVNTSAIQRIIIAGFAIKLYYYHPAGGRSPQKNPHSSAFEIIAYLITLNNGVMEIEGPYARRRSIF
jgi:TRAP-type uncharacterized transport system fused permease subunit